MTMKRFKALDVFRGLTICLMILVNTPGDWGSTFGPLLHAQWHGFTPTDLVFPSFLFAVGTAFAFVKDRWAAKPLGAVFGKIFRRTVIIFLLGYIMYWFPFMKWGETGTLTGFPIGETRILGVLQRIALCYFAGAILVYYCTRRNLIIVGAGILLTYWGVLYAFGDYTLEGNFVRTVDLWLFGPDHLYHGEGLAFDPEGLLSTLPAIVNVLAGYLAGHYLIKGGIHYENLSKLLLVAILCMAGAYWWDQVFPINKKLWTSSYVLLTVGLDLALLALILYTTDFAQRKWEYRFFEIFGKNSLFIYLFSEYLAITLLFIRVDGEKSFYRALYENAFAWIGPYWGSLAFAVVFMLFCWSFNWWLDRRKIYIRV
jgi:predicted acyltransferase